MTTTPRTRRLLHGWRALLLAAALLAAGAWWNDRAARSAPLQPLHPKDAQWVFATTDFPAFWTSLENGGLMTRIAGDWPRPQAALELAARFSTGIRPTPARWRLWLGYRLAVSGTDDGIGFSVYPGWLLRAADSALALVARNRDADGVSRYRDWYYGWRDGFLFASTSRGLVVSCITRPDPTPLECRADGAPVFQWSGKSEGYLRFLPGKGTPVEGSISAAVSDGSAPLTLSRAWPEPPAVSVAVRDAVSLRALADLCAGVARQFPVGLHVSEVAIALANAWGLDSASLPSVSGSGHVAAALLDVHSSHPLPIPAIALAVRDTGPSVPPSLTALPDTHPIVYEWNGFAGSMTPLIGDRLSLYACQAGDDALFATSEPVMASLVGRLSPGPAENAEVDAVVTADWKKIAQALMDLAQTAGEYQLLPRMNIDDVRHTLSPRLTGLSKLGTLNLTGRAAQGRIEFSGVLFQPAVQETP